MLFGKKLSKPHPAEGRNYLHIKCRFTQLQLCKDYNHRLNLFFQIHSKTIYENTKYENYKIYHPNNTTSWYF